MDQKLKDKLPQLSLATLHQLDHGKLQRQFSRCLGRVAENIREFPVRNGKPEPREITIKLVLTPEVRKVKKLIENSFGSSEVEIPELCGLFIKAIIKDKLPIFETSDITMATDIKNGQICDIRFNPNNSDNPNQLEMDFDDEPESLGGDDDDDDSE